MIGSHTIARIPCRYLIVFAALFAHMSPLQAFEIAQPASFEGTLPCADCPGIDWHLDVWPDGRFHLRRHYQDRDANDDDLGQWRVRPEDGSLLLQGSRESPLRLQVLDANTLRLLDLQGKTIESTLPYELRRLEVFAPTEISKPMGGEFRYYADSASFLECRTGHRYPVLMEGDYINAERRYLALQRDPQTASERLYFQVEASIVNRQAMPPEGPGQSLFIERIVTDVPGLGCERAMSNASLFNTYWRLLRLNNEVVDKSVSRKEPHLVLSDSDQSVRGFGGCNQMRGSYVINGGGISFGPVASTRMACPGPAMALEQQFHKALAQSAAWRIAGQTLELMDEASGSLLVFEAVYLP